MESEVNDEEPLSCTQCEVLGEISFPDLHRIHQNAPAKIRINNLPVGIQKSGIRNLFLSVGKPKSIEFQQWKALAFVEFESRNEAELAVRDLNETPPYFLKVSMILPKVEREINVEDKIFSQDDKENGFSSPEIFADSLSQRIPQNEDFTENSIEEPDDKLKEEKTWLEAAIKLLNYDPSIRMRQKKLDFQRKWNSVSLGRGYYFIEKDLPVEGLQTFTTASEGCTIKDEEEYWCENCKSLTVKYCEKSFKPYCSSECFNRSNFNGLRSEEVAKNSEGNESRFCGGFSVDLNGNDFFNEDYEALESGCDVLISSYCSQQTVFIRRIDEPWEEFFVRLNNDVAVAAMTGEKPIINYNVGDLCIARYHQDLCFYRAKVCFLEDNKATVMFVDFGNIQTTEVEDLKPLPEHLKQIVGMAIKVELKNVPKSSSLESVNYLNELTAERIPLVLESGNVGEGVVLMEKGTGQGVNVKVTRYSLPSWRVDESVLSKLGEIFFMESFKLQTLEIGQRYNLYVSYFDEKEFFELKVLWVVLTEADDYYHVRTEMKERMRKYCELLKGDFYLPRVNEVCLAKEKGEWHRCVNLKSIRTTCFLFFLDNGHSSYIETKNIRKIVRDFTEAPSQAICCKLSGDLQHDREVESKVLERLRSAVGRTLRSVFVDHFENAVYSITVPEIEKLITHS